MPNSCKKGDSLKRGALSPIVTVYSHPPVCARQRPARVSGQPHPPVPGLSQQLAAYPPLLGSLAIR